MAVIVDSSALSQNLNESKLDYAKIFQLKLASGFAAKADMVVLPIDQKVELMRDALGNIVQPGRKGTTNFSQSFLDFKSRKQQLMPAKVDLYLDELQLYQLKTGFLGKKEPADPKDINSIAGRNYIMGRVFDQIGKEINRSIVKGVAGYGYDATNATTQAASVFQGGLNLFDGLAAKFLAGYATTGTGAVGDIPGSNKVSNPVTTVSQANILAELAKMVDIIYESEDLQQYIDEDASLILPPTWYQYMVNALAAALSNGSQIVSKGADGKYRFNLLPNTVIKPRIYMVGVDNMFWTPDDNLYYLYEDVGTDVPMLKFQELDRGVKILIDFELNVDYADGRVVVLYK